MPDSLPPATDRTSLKGRVALVTGAGRGIGAGVAEALWLRGAHVVVNDLDPDTAQATADHFGDRGTAAPGDVSDAAAVASVVETATAAGGVHILVNNAGIDEAISILDMSEAAWDRLIDVNLKSVFLVTKAVLPSMIAHGGGSVICMGSIVARQGAMNGGIHYAASKGAILAFVKTLARQMAVHNVRANAIAPGVVDTDLIRTHMKPEMREKVMAAIPRGRLARIDEVGAVAAFLASDAADYVNGATIDVNGGFWIG